MKMLAETIFTDFFKLISKLASKAVLHVKSHAVNVLIQHILKQGFEDIQPCLHFCYLRHV